MSINEHPPQHVPVLLDAVLQTLNPQPGESYLDLTAGYGGHASAIIDKTRNYNGAVLADRDDYAIEHLQYLADKGASLIHSDFVAAAKQLVSEGKKFSMILVDLGVSSPQLDQGTRGFSFTNSGPLDMRMDRRQDITAERIVNKASERELVSIIHEYGEEPIGRAHAIASKIIASRPLRTTEELAKVVASTHHGGWKRTHPATRTFQALRIAVNDELGQIKKLLPLLPDLLEKGGRVGIISFHSLEDRLVKRFFKELFEAGFETELASLTKKPIAGDIYDVHNPRARSSKLRAAVKI